MFKLKNSRNSNWKVIIYGVLSLAFLSAIAMPIRDNKKHFPTAPAGNVQAGIVDGSVSFDQQQAEESKAAFQEAYTVFMSPRCMNCHPAGDVPLQGDDSHLHTMGVKRGRDGKGLFAMKCKNCHQDTNTPGENMPPGHFKWQLPPASHRMVFEGKSPKQLAANFKDPKYTGFKSMHEFIKHVEDDTLVKHSFTYGTRPPLSHEDFVVKVKEWISKGAVVPDK